QFNGKLWRQLYHDVDVSRLQAEEKAETMALKLAPWRTLMNNVLSKKKDSLAGQGAVILHARQGKVTGDKLRYENQPPKDTLGFWVNKNDFVEWEFDLPSAGTFEVELLQGCGK